MAMNMFSVDDLIAVNAQTGFSFMSGGGFTTGLTPVVTEEMSVTPLDAWVNKITRATGEACDIFVDGYYAARDRLNRVDEVHAVPITYREHDGVWSWWSQTKNTLSRATLTLCCCGHVVNDWDREITFDRAVRRQMLETNVVPEGQTMESFSSDMVNTLNKEKVQHVPALVANVVVALRMKLGVGAMDRTTPGNVTLVRAESARMLREWNVRTKDAAAHLLAIERCFFRDDTHYQLTTWRAKASRKSRFVSWILGKEDVVSFDF